MRKFKSIWITKIDKNFLFELKKMKSISINSKSNNERTPDLMRNYNVRVYKERKR